MSDFAKFLEVNGLKRKDIASFLGVSGAFITQLRQGTRPLPPEKLAMLKENAYGWDVSMLTAHEQSRDEDFKISKVNAHRNSILGDYVSLVDLLNQKDEEIIRLHKRIWELEQLLEAKGGCNVQGADCSSDAHVG